jgi:hypothetical protein
MNRNWGGNGCKPQQRFCLRFKRRMRELLAQGHSAADSFGRVWERTLEAVPLEDSDQARIYWELIEWAGSAELFTDRGTQDVLNCWRETVHDL